MKYLLALFVVLLCAVLIIGYHDHVEWMKYAKENKCSATGKQMMNTYTYFINVNNQMLPQQGVTITSEFHCKKTNEYFWR